MPTRPIQQHQAVIVGKQAAVWARNSDIVAGIDPGHERQRAEFAIEGADGGQAVDELADDLLTDDGTQGPKGPSSGADRDPARNGLRPETADAREPAGSRRITSWRIWGSFLELLPHRRLGSGVARTRPQLAPPMPVQQTET